MAVKSIGCQMGKLLPSGMTAVVMSLSNADAILSIGGKNHTITMTTKFCDDRNTFGAVNGDGVDNHVCYIGIKVLTGLSPLTKYDWSIVQGSNTDSGFQYTAAATKQSRVAIASSTCLNLTHDNAGGLTGYNFLRSYIDEPANPPVLANCHQDDICYADGAFSGITAGAANSQGKEFTDGEWSPSATPTQTRPAYDWGLYYASWFGILEPFYNIGDEETPRMTAGLDEDFQYCLARMAFVPSAGDHEYGNNLGWKVTAGLALADVPNPYHHTTDGFNGKGLQAWNECMQYLQGTSIDSVASNTKHFMIDFGGGLRYIALDATTNAVYGVSVYGNQQQLDALNQVDGSAYWYNIAAPAGGCRTAGAVNAYPTYNTYVDTISGALPVSYKNEGYVQAEFDRMWRSTEQTPKSLMDSEYGNGAMGMAYLTRGDWHQSLWCRWTASAEI